jgi:transglutaminase-like putative cysteine protease
VLLSALAWDFWSFALFRMVTGLGIGGEYTRMAMPILSIKHVTSYRYRRPVAFGEHRMMLRPRDDDDQRLLQSDLEMTPKPRELAWGRDGFGKSRWDCAFRRPF